MSLDLSLKFLVSLIVSLPGLSMAGFLCKDRFLYSSQNEGFIAIYSSQSQCREAVAKSKEGFICEGGFLYSEQSPRYIANLFSPNQCDDAVSEAKNGFLCADGWLYNQRQALIYFGSDEACLASLD